MNMKKLISLALALVMLLAMSATAMAAYQYEIYQIFTGDYSEGILSNVKWGVNGTGTTGTAVDATILEELSAVNSSNSNSEKLDIILKYVNLAGDPHMTGTADTYTLANGYYLVKDVDKSLDGTNDAYTTYVVEVVDNTLTIIRKSDVPEVEKKIVENGKDVDENEASIGDTITYKFTGTLPTNIEDYNTYYYVFHDTLSAGLTYTNQLKVTVNGVDVTKYFYVKADPENKTTNVPTTLTVGIQDLLALELVEGVGQITKDTKVIVTYTAELNEYALVGTTGNKNDVKLQYSNDPNNDGTGATTPPPENPDKPNPSHPTGETPKDEVFTYTTEIIINKVDQDNNVLTGAEFTITGNGVKAVVVTGDVFVENTNGTYWKLKDGTYTTEAPVTAEGETNNAADYESVTTKYSKETKVTVDTTESNVEVKAFVDSNGQVKFTGLGAGTYTITESVTPAGYNTIEPITVEITWSKDGTNCTWTYEWSHDEDEKDNEVTIVNKSGATLPETGAQGTKMIYMVGGILVAAAAILLITKRRMNAAE